MHAALRALGAELHALLHSVRGVLLAIVLPAVILVLVGQLRVRPPSYRILVAGTATAVGPAHDDVEAVLGLLREMSRFEIVEDSAPAADPFEVLRDRQLDAVLNVGDLGSEGWSFYTAETRAVRLAGLEDLAARLQRTLGVRGARPSSASPATITDEFEDAVALGVVRPDAMHSYYPRAADQSLGVLAITVALIICFLPFVLAAPSLIRDREEHTLEMVLVAPGARWWSVLVAKTGAAVVVGLFTLALLTVLTQTLYGVYLKPGSTVLFVLAAAGMVASTALALAVSAAATSQSQVTAASGLYFLALIVFTGLLVPLSESSPMIVAISRALPVTFVYPAVQSWMVGDGSSAFAVIDVAWLAAQATMYGGIAVYLFRRTTREL
jgi:ABC-type multidrug transport system permease subunit